MRWNKPQPKQWANKNQPTINPVQQTNRPHPTGGTIAVRQRWDKYSTHPSQYLDPQELGAIFLEAEQGNIKRQMELFEEMEEKDSHLASQLGTRKNAVSGLDWEIQPASDSEKDREVAKVIGDIIHRIEDFDDVILDLMDAIGKGYSVAEIMWGYEKGFVVPQKIEWVMPKKFHFDDFDNLRLLTSESPSEGILLPENKFIVHKYKAKSGSLTRAGILRVVAWMYLFKNYSLKDWLAFSEVYGMPIRLGKYEPGTSQEDKEALMEAVRNLGADAAGVISNSTVIEFIESQRSEGLLYDRLIKLCNAEISKAILGQTLTSDSGENGSRALGDVHDLVRYDLLKADCRALQKTIRRDLLRPLVEFNFGKEVDVPYLKIACERPEDSVQEVSKYTSLICSIGLPVTAEHLYEKFSIPVPEEGQTIVLPPTASPMTGALPFKRVAAKKDSQDLVDTEAGSITKTAQSVIEGSLNQLLMIIEDAESVEGLRESLVREFKNLPASELDELIERAFLYAELQGRAGVVEDAE